MVDLDHSRTIRGARHVDIRLFQSVLDGPRRDLRHERGCAWLVNRAARQNCHGFGGEPPRWFRDWLKLE